MCVPWLFFPQAPYPMLKSLKVLSCACLHLFNNLFSSLCVCPVCLFLSLSSLFIGFLLSFLKILHGLPVSPGAERSFK